MISDRNQTLWEVFRPVAAYDGAHSIKRTARALSRWQGGQVANRWLRRWRSDRCFEESLALDFEAAMRRVVR